MRSPLFLSLLALVPLFSGCRHSRCDDVSALPDPGDVLVVGDSILAWNHDRCQSVADHLALARGAAVTSRAISGTRVLDGEGRIPEQVVEGDWRVVVVDGGGNDLNKSCACGACGEVLDALVSEDGTTGAMPELVDRLVERGARVVLLRYYEVPDGAWWGFDRCHEVLFELGERYQALAAAREGVTLVDARDVITPSESDAYDFDRVHPSDEGAAILGAHLAEVVAAP